MVYGQHDPDSPYYHQWLTPETHSQMFGVSDNDLAQVTTWLQQHGMTIDEVPPGRRTIIFSGTAAQVAATFRTQIHSYQVGAEVHHANASDPDIPAALAGVVGGVVSLHDFRSSPLNRPLNRPSPAFTSGGGHYLAPADFATVYNLGPLYQQSVNAAGRASPSWAASISTSPISAFSAVLSGFRQTTRKSS